MGEDKDWLKGARECMDLHFKLADEFNPLMANLYSDDALIQNTVLNSDGSQQTRVIPASYYKSIIAKAMCMAKEMGDIYTYSNLEFKKEGDRVRVTYVRYSHLRDYSSPVSMLMGLDGDEAGMVFEELSVMKGYG
jgi:hypothetical protein